MSTVVIVGGGDFLPEVLWAVRDVQSAGVFPFTVRGILDDNPRVQDSFAVRGITFPYLGSTAAYASAEDEFLVCAIAQPAAKIAVCGRLLARGCRFVSVIHPTAALESGATIGVGAFIWHHAVISANVVIGDFVTINCFSTCGHDARIGSGCTISSHCDVTGHVRLGDGVFLGSRSSVLPGATVGEFAKVGAGSVVLRSVKPYSTVFGVPAKAI